MKKTISLLVGAVVAQGITATAMANGPIDGVVYGKLNTAIIMEDSKNGDDDTYLSNWSSRLGFKGKTEIEDGIYVVYKLEYGIDPDEKAEKDTAQIFKQRNSYIGLKSKSYGTIIAGTHDTPLKKVQGNIDMFDRLPNGDIKNVIVGQERLNDLVHYTSPSMSGVTLKAATQLQETGDGENGTSVSATYEEGAIFAAIGFDKDVNDSGAKYDASRLAFQYKGDGFTAGLIYSNSEKSEGNYDSNDGLILSGSYMIDAINLKAQYGAGDEKDEGTTLISFGADYIFSKKTKLFGYVSGYENDANEDSTTLGFGMEHNF